MLIKTIFKETSPEDRERDLVRDLGK